MSLPLIFSPEAENDLSEVLAYIARDKPGAAARFVARLQEACRFVAQDPHAGQSCSELRPGMRRFTCEGYVIYFRQRDPAIEIVRVIHGARDWPSLD